MVFIGIVAAGGFAQGVTGFGFALVVVPPAVAIVDRFTVITALNVLGPALNAFLVRRIRAPIEGRLVRIVLVASVAGMPVGILVLKLVPVGAFRVLAGLLAILMATLMQLWRVELPQNPRVFAGTGFVSGVLQTSTTMSGPPLVVLLLSGRRLVAVIRRTLALLFLAQALPALALLAVAGSVTRDGFIYGFAALPVVALSGYLGDRVARRLPRESFRRISLTMVYAAGVVAVVVGLR